MLTNAHARCYVQTVPPELEEISSEISRAKHAAGLVCPPGSWIRSERSPHISKKSVSNSMRDGDGTRARGNGRREVSVTAAGGAVVGSATGRK